MKKQLKGITTIFVGLLFVYQATAQRTVEQALSEVMAEKKANLEEADYVCLSMSRDEYLADFERLSEEYLKRSPTAVDNKFKYLYGECVDYYLFKTLKDKGLTEEDYGKCMNEMLMGGQTSQSSVSSDQLAGLLKSTTSNVSESDIGLPLYPNREMVSAFTSEQATQFSKAYVKDFSGEALASVVYTSEDEWTEIVAFYEERLSGFQKIMAENKVLFAKEYVDIDHLANPDVMVKWATEESILIRKLDKEGPGATKIEIHYE